jgi:hypothetical protein
MPPYSSTPLLKKLGIKSNKIIGIYNAPTDFIDLLGELPEGVMIGDESAVSMDFIISFHIRMASLQEVLTNYKPQLAKDGMIWIAWPKASSKVTTDLNRDYIREYFLENGLVDVKVASINEIWSGLKFVYRLKDR